MTCVEHPFANRVPARFEAVLRSVPPILCFVVPTILITNYTLNHFYVSGGYFLDSGWYSFMSAHASGWPMRNPPAVVDNFFAIHFSPIFYFSSAIYSLFFPWMPSAAFFSIMHGSFFGCISLAIWRLIGDHSKLWTTPLALFLSLITAFNGVALAAIGFPHIEIGIPALLLLALGAYYRNERVLFCIFLIIGLSLREDAGLHYFGVFFLLFLWSGLPMKIGGEGSFRRAYLAIAVSCFAYAAFVIFLQRTFFQGEWDQLRHVYLGSPPFAHVTWDFINDRISAYSSVLYIFAPLGLIIALSLCRRDIFLAIGLLSVVPWLVLSFFAPFYQAGILRSYYGFPVMIAILWPAVAYRASRVQRPTYIFHLLIVTGLSTILFITGARSNHDNAPWKSFGFQWRGKSKPNQQALENLFLDHKLSGRWIVDDAVASLMPAVMTKENWKYGLAWGPEIPTIDTLIFQPVTWQGVTWDTIIKEASLHRICRLGSSNFFIATRTQDSFASCEPVQGRR